MERYSCGLILAHYITNKTKPAATSATSATFETENSETVFESRKVAKIAEPYSSKNIILICYSPSGLAYEIKATSAEHAEFLQRKNPKPTKEISQ